MLQFDANCFLLELRLAPKLLGPAPCVLLEEGQVVQRIRLDLQHQGRGRLVRGFGLLGVMESNPYPGFTSDKSKAQLAPIRCECLCLGTLERVPLVLIMEISRFDVIPALPCMQVQLEKQEQQETTQTFHGCLGS